jgi:hypothetical protein
MGRECKISKLKNNFLQESLYLQPIMILIIVFYNLCVCVCVCVCARVCVCVCVHIILSVGL